MRVPHDPALPRLGVLLDPDAMAPMLERSLGRPARVDAARIARISYKPGERVTVHYEVDVGGRCEDAVARTVAGRDLGARAGRARVLELARRVRGRSPAVNPVSYDADADALITWLPLDPRLPALAEAPQQLARRLEEAGVEVTAAPAEPRRLSYKPGRRAVLRVDGHVLKAYGSTRQFASAQAGLRAGSAVFGIATPRFEAVLQPLRLTVQAAIEGAPAPSLAGALEAGALVRTLQRADVRLAPASHSAQLDAAIRKTELIGTVLPPLARRVDGLVRRLRLSAPPPGRLMPAHGDLHAGQLLRHEGALRVLDLDSMCLGPPALDLAEYAAEATEAGLEKGTAVLDALLDGYGPKPDGLDWHLAVAILVRSSHPFHRALPAWTERVETMVAAAEAVLPRTRAARSGLRRWLDPLHRELDDAPAPRTFFFRDDDAGWASDRLLSLLDLFAHYAIPLDLAVIPAVLDPLLAATLRTRAERDAGLLSLHQHGFAHTNHEPAGRPCEFGPARPERAQREDIAAGARRLRALLGPTPPIFTPPWNRCTETTGRCLLDLGFRALVRDSSARALELEGLRELAVDVDWSGRRKGQRIRRTDVGLLLAAACRRGPTGIMLHHALVGGQEREDLERLLALLAAHENARCVPLSALVSG